MKLLSCPLSDTDAAFLLLISCEQGPEFKYQFVILWMPTLLWAVVLKKVLENVLQLDVTAERCIQWNQHMTVGFHFTCFLAPVKSRSRESAGYSSWHEFDDLCEMIWEKSTLMLNECQGQALNNTGCLFKSSLYTCSLFLYSYRFLT